jgi:DNA-binding response OmpR family regulator
MKGHDMARILIIDDEEQIRTMLKRVLEREGHETMAASNGRLGMRIHLKDPADLVITDIIMPEQEGIETIIKLRRESPRTKIIAISGGGDVGAEGYLAMAGKLGAQVTLQKPFGLEEILMAVRNLLATPSKGEQKR